MRVARLKQLSCLRVLSEFSAFAFANLLPPCSQLPSGRDFSLCSCRSSKRELSATIPKFVSDAKQTRRFFVSGLVQGVGYRYFAQSTAERLGICGYARNLFDGRVEVLAVGSARQLDEMKTELQRGPRFSSVSSVREEQAQSEPHHERRFVIAPDA